MASYEIREEHAQDSPDARMLQDAVDDHNMTVTQERDFWPVALCLRDEEGTLCGGLTGGIWAGWLQIKVLWLRQDARREGHGSRLLREAERYAREKGALYAHTSSFSFQAPEFYLKHGYETFGELSDYPRGERQVFLKKDLGETPRAQKPVVSWKNQTKVRSPSEVNS